MPKASPVRQQHRPGRPLKGGTPGSFTAPDPNNDADLPPLTAELTVPRDRTVRQPGQTMARVDQHIIAAGLTEAQIADELRAVQQLIDNAQVAVRVWPGALTVILRTGEFRTLHETGESGGSADIDTRAAAELQLFGEHERSPVYAYLSTDTDRGGAGSPSMYGTVKVVLRDDVRARTTVSGEDSLNMGVLPSPIADVDRYSFRWQDPDVATLTSALINDVATGNRYAYCEAQVHGGVSSDNIDSVWVTGGTDSEYIAGWAASAPHITFHIDGVEIAASP